MSKLTRDCPHCYTKNVSFASFAEKKKVNEERLFVTAFHCETCYGGYIAEIECLLPSTTADNTNGSIEKNDHFIIKKEYPLPESVKAPKHLPENINKFYLQAANSLNSGNHDASAMMSRKVLEVAVKALEPEGNGKLYHRIEALAASGKITEELKDWAHIIRDDGNGATHEEEPVTPDFSSDLLSFAEMFLMYTFTMPGMVSERRNDAQDEVQTD